MKNSSRFSMWFQRPAKMKHNDAINQNVGKIFVTAVSGCLKNWLSTDYIETKRCYHYQQSENPINNYGAVNNYLQRPYQDHNKLV